MYAIFEIIYGIPLHKNDQTETKWSKELEDAIDNEEDGFHTYYSGGSDCIPAVFGIEIGEFDEACHHVELNGLTITPSQKHRLEFDVLIKTLSKTLHTELAEKYGQPRVFFLATTS